jgi:hypothetical protein
MILMKKNRTTTRLPRVPSYPSLEARISEDRKTLEVQIFNPEEGLYSSTFIAPQSGIDATHLVYFTNPFNRKTTGVLYSHDEIGMFRNCALVHGPKPRKLYERIAHKTA